MGTNLIAVLFALVSVCMGWISADNYLLRQENTYLREQLKAISRPPVVNCPSAEWFTGKEGQV